MDAPLRNDQSFSQRIDDDHHHEVFPSTNLKFGLVSQCVLDYMHLICLGVVCKIIFLWLSGPAKTGTKLPENQINQMSNRLLSLGCHIPKNFARRPRSLQEAKMWKATEFRQFLLYTGSVILHGILKSTFYQNFLLLSVSTRLLLSHCIFSTEYLKKLFKIFVKIFLLFMESLGFLIMCIICYI